MPGHLDGGEQGGLSALVLDDGAIVDVVVFGGPTRLHNGQLVLFGRLVGACGGLGDARIA